MIVQNQYDIWIMKGWAASALRCCGNLPLHRLLLLWILCFSLLFSHSCSTILYVFYHWYNYGHCFPGIYIVFMVIPYIAIATLSCSAWRPDILKYRRCGVLDCLYTWKWEVSTFFMVVVAARTTKPCSKLRINSRLRNLLDGSTTWAACVGMWGAGRLYHGGAYPYSALRYVLDRLFQNSLNSKHISDSPTMLNTQPLQGELISVSYSQPQNWKLQKSPLQEKHSTQLSARATKQASELQQRRTLSLPHTQLSTHIKRAVSPNLECSAGKCISHVTMRPNVRQVHTHTCKHKVRKSKALVLKPRFISRGHQKNTLIAASYKLGMLTHQTLSMY